MVTTWEAVKTAINGLLDAVRPLTESDMLNLLLRTNSIAAYTDSDGCVMTDENGSIMV